MKVLRKTTLTMTRDGQNKVLLQTQIKEGNKSSWESDLILNDTVAKSYRKQGGWTVIVEGGIKVLRKIVFEEIEVSEYQPVDYNGPRRKKNDGTGVSWAEMQLKSREKSSSC